MALYTTKANVYYGFHDENEWMMRLSVQKYLAFVKAVECGSFTRAAEALNYTQSGISRMISDLEAEWGVALLDRGKSGVMLTSDGLKLLPQVQRICNEQGQLNALVKNLHDGECGLIRIGTFSSVATHWLPHMIKRFQQDYPGIEFELLLGDYTEIEAWISQGRVDYGFLRLPTEAAFETIAVEEQDRLLVVLPKVHPLAKCDKFPMKALEGDPFMLLEKSAKAEIAAIFEKNQLHPQVRFTTWDDYAIMSMVENGLGISILPELILQRVPYDIVVKELEIPAFRRIGLAMRNKNALGLAAKHFLAYIPYRKSDAISTPCLTFTK